ncbi:MAG: glycosyltransferase family 4 protein [Chloroflexi bacterium]|nr:glycosyltransferase family 4 protein [Chloroflexota bacterium]
MQSFERYLESIGWQVVRDPKERAEFLFTNHWMTPPGALFKAIRRNPAVCIVQRIDGAAQDYGRAEPEADRTQAAVNRLANLTIFQSQYSRYATREKHSIISQDGPVIWNPVDLETFNPEGPARDYPQEVCVAAVSWSANPRKGAASLYACAEQNPDIGFALCGNFPDAPRLPNLHLLGVLGRADLAVALRGAAALLTFSQNEACPNHVLEALACGRPVLYADSGAMAEVTGPAGLPVSEKSFRAQLERLQGNRAALANAARARAEREFNPALIFPRYAEAMQAARKRRSPRRLAQRWLAALRDGLSRLI